MSAMAIFLFRRNTIASLIFLSIALLVAPAISHAATGLSIQPIKIDETLAPGASTSGNILLTNASDGPINVVVSKQDFIPVSGAESIQFVGRTAGVTSVIDWITVGAASTFSFKKGESRQVPYTITAPPNAEPGSHFGVVLFKATPKVEGGGSLQVGTQVGVLVLITVPGDHLAKGKILEFSAPQFVQTGPVPFSIKFQNTGTVHFEPKGSIIISNMLGQKVAEVPISGVVVLPTSVKILNEAWDATGLLLGKYTAVATIVDGDGNALTSDTISFWAFPIWYGVSFFITLIVLYILIRFIKRRVKIKVSLH